MRLELLPSSFPLAAGQFTKKARQDIPISIISIKFKKLTIIFPHGSGFCHKE